MVFIPVQILSYTNVSLVNVLMVYAIVVNLIIPIRDMNVRVHLAVTQQILGAMKLPTV